jgi:hypothetical protein
MYHMGASKYFPTFASEQISKSQIGCKKEVFARLGTSRLISLADMASRVRA